MDEHCCSTQLIDGDGAFNDAGIENFIKMVKLAECGLSYAVVSIMGPQSSGMLASYMNYYCKLFNPLLFDFLPFVFSAANTKII